MATAAGIGDEGLGKLPAVGAQGVLKDGKLFRFTAVAADGHDITGAAQVGEELAEHQLGSGVE